MNLLKGEQKSWTTRQSDVNPNTIIENSFLEDFFRHILADVHQGKILHFRQKLQHLKQFEKSKALQERLFEVADPISLQAIMDNLNHYFMQKSPSFADGELNQLLEMKFSNNPAKYPTFQTNELLMVDVKIKADSERIEKMPAKMKEMLVSLQEQQNSYCPLAQRLRNYKEEYVNFVVVYFGYYNFSMVKNTHFEDQQICLFGRKLKLRINAIFVSKVALMETFKSVCKVPNLEEIDELLIQLYELKRIKAKVKKNRKTQNQNNKSKKQKKNKEESFSKIEIKQNLGLKAVIGITAVGVAVAIGKFFS